MAEDTEMPVAIGPRYSTTEPNAPILLYDGSASISTNGEPIMTTARVRLKWLPSPRVEICISDYCLHDAMEDGTTAVSLQDRPRALDILWTSAHMWCGEKAGAASTVGIVQNHAFDKDADFQRVVFHVANGPKFRGTHIRNKAGTMNYLGRVELQVPPWNIVIDIVPGQQDQKASQKLKDAGGYAITHAGYVEREDHVSFRVADVEPLLKSVGWLLSFCRGAWAFPLLLVGEDEAGAPVSEAWRCGSVAPMQTFLSWFGDGSWKRLKLLDGLHRRLSDAIWQEPTELALYWYLTSNNVQDTSVEGGIMLQQAAFELLAWTLLVQDRAILSEDGAQKLPAADKLRLLLSDCGIPLAIAPELNSLRASAKEYNWPDGPSATTEIRNALVHANPDKRARILKKGFNCRYEAWLLGQWYLELILLRLFNYTGRYSNRLSRADGNVPWVDQAVTGEAVT